MKLPGLLWWLPPVVMAGALAVDLVFVHAAILSFAALWLCCTGGVRQWKRGNRKIAVVLFVIGSGGWAYALLETMQLATVEIASARSVATAVRCYTQSTGKRPQGLDELVPKYLANLPQARSPIVGKIRYSLTGDKDWCVSWKTGGVCSNVDPKPECSSTSSTPSVQKP